MGGLFSRPRSEGRSGAAEESPLLPRRGESSPNLVSRGARNIAAAQPHLALAYAFYAFFLSGNINHVALSRGSLFYFEMQDLFLQLERLSGSTSAADRLQYAALMVKAAIAMTALLCSAFDAHDPDLAPELFCGVFALAMLVEIAKMFSEASARLVHALKAILTGICLVGLLDGLVFGNHTEGWGETLIAVQGLLWLNVVLGDPFNRTSSPVRLPAAVVPSPINDEEAVGDVDADDITPAPTDASRPSRCSIM